MSKKLFFVTSSKFQGKDFDRFGINILNKKYKVSIIDLSGIINKRSYSILELAKLFSNNIKIIPERRGERFKSSEVKKIRNYKIINLIGKTSLNNYIKEIKNI